MITDLNGSLWSRQFLNVANERKVAKRFYQYRDHFEVI